LATDLDGRAQYAEEEERKERRKEGRKEEKETIMSSPEAQNLLGCTDPDDGGSTYL
jgi:hypothetical protein